MVALLREFPDVRMTFNLVPSLMVQLDEFAEDRARDRTLDLGLKPAAALTDDDKRFVLANFFHAQRARMIDPYPRYAELLRRRDQSNGGAWRQFTDADFRDLQVWSKLVWVDPFFETDPRIVALHAKGSGFSEEDKASLRAVELDVLRAVVPEYRAAAARGQVELAASPFYHPILPLLCDTDVYLRTHPQSRMPRHRFRHPEDARAQLERAAADHERRFGVRPTGLWPSEGSVSEAMVPLAAGAGFSLDGDRRADPRPDAGGGTAARRVRASRAAGSPVPAVHGEVRRRGDRVSVPRPRAVGFDRVHLRVVERRRRRARLRGPSGRRRTAVFGADRRRGSRDSDHPGRRERVGALRGPGPTLPSSALPGARQPSRDSDGHDGGGLQGTGGLAQHDLPRAPGSTPTSISGSATRTTIARGDNWPTRGRRSSRRAPGSRRRRSSGPGTSCTSPRGPTGSGGTATTTRPSTTSSSTTCSGGTSETSTG